MIMYTKLGPSTMYKDFVDNLGSRVVITLMHVRVATYLYTELFEKKSTDTQSHMSRY